MAVTRIRVTPSPSTDVVRYVMFYPDGKLSFDLRSLGLNLDDDYDIAIAAEDDAGNYSAPLSAINVPFDFVAPDPPADLELLES